jgi:hypothetical protein
VISLDTLETSAVRDAPLEAAPHPPFHAPHGSSPPGTVLRWRWGAVSASTTTGREKPIFPGTPCRSPAARWQTGRRDGRAGRSAGVYTPSRERWWELVGEHAGEVWRRDSCSSRAPTPVGEWAGAWHLRSRPLERLLRHNGPTCLIPEYCHRGAADAAGRYSCMPRAARR